MNEWMNKLYEAMNKIEENEKRTLSTTAVLALAMH